MGKQFDLLKQVLEEAIEYHKGLNMEKKESECIKGINGIRKMVIWSYRVGCVQGEIVHMLRLLEKFMDNEDFQNGLSVLNKGIILSVHEQLKSLNKKLIP